MAAETLKRREKGEGIRQDELGKFSFLLEIDL